MKRFKVEGWYRCNDEKDFKSEIIECYTKRKALDLFANMYNWRFFKITAEEIE